MTERVVDLLGEACADERRRVDLLAHPTLNGIDYVEVDAADHRIVRLYFFKPLPAGDPTDPGDPADAYGLSTHPRKIRIAGGTRVVGIRVRSATRQTGGLLEVRVDRGGDWSPYVLTIDSERLDPFFRSVRFSFMAACPTEGDCDRDEPCPPSSAVEPLLDYLAKDYASFRRMLLDLLPQLDPAYAERNPSDLGIALVELLAYVGDHLSYFQDAVANEAYLETVRRRISARRHARLVDYRMHDGRNAWTVVHFAVDRRCKLPGPPNVVRVLSGVPAPLAGTDAPPGVLIDAAVLTPGAITRDPALHGVAVFELAHGAVLDPRNNEISIHAWGNDECCLPSGATEAFLYTVRDGRAVQPQLHAGDLLLLEEVLGPTTGAAADASPSHRAAVTLEEVEDAEDPLYGDRLAADGGLLRREDGEDPLPLLRVRWRRRDALGFALCLSVRIAGGALVRDVSVARGNLVVADHGLSVVEPLRDVPAGERIFRLRLGYEPLTCACLPAHVDYDPGTGRTATERRELDCPVEEAEPIVSVRVRFPTGPTLWRAVPDLLDSSATDEHLVPEVDDDGRAILRFGDGEYGRRPDGATRFVAAYRVGNGRAGNVGADALVHVALPPAGLDCVGWIRAVRNPLPAQGGVDPETIEEVRQRAPAAFRARRLRAVTEADYTAAARELPEISGAAASFRWTGSWYTVFVGLDPRDPAELVESPDGRTQLAPELEEKVRAFLETRRLAGYDVELRPPEYVPLELELELCVGASHFRTDVVRAVGEALSNRDLPSGGRGFFHPERFSFGQPVYLSRIYAAVEHVPGVDSVVARAFHRYGQFESGELESGVLPIGPWEVARLDDDPNFVEHGVLRLTAGGGKG